jgi:hypothetical protein
MNFLKKWKRNFGKEAVWEVYSVCASTINNYNCKLKWAAKANQTNTASKQQRHTWTSKQKQPLDSLKKYLNGTKSLWHSQWYFHYFSKYIFISTFCRSIQFTMCPYPNTAILAGMSFLPTICKRSMMMIVTTRRFVIAYLSIIISMSRNKMSS